MHPNIAGTAPPQDDDAATTPITAWYALAVLILTTIFAFVDRQILNLVFPSLQTSLRLSDLQLGALQGLGMAIFASAASYPMGWLADRYGRKLVLVAGIIIWSLSTAACAYQTSFTGLFIATIGIAVGEAGLMPIIFAMIPDIFRTRHRSTANFIYFAATILGGAVGVMLGGAAIGWLTANASALPAPLASLEAWRAAILIVALPAPIFILLVATLPVGRSSATAGAAAGGADADAGATMLPFLRRHRATFICIFGGIFGYCLPLSAAYGWLPLAAFRTFGLPPEAAGVQMGSAMAIASVVGVTFPGISLKFVVGDTVQRSLRIAKAFLLLAIVPTLFLPFATSSWAMFVTAACQLTLLIGVAALMPGIVQDMSPGALRSRILSFVGIVLAVGHAASPLFVGALSGLLTGERGVLVSLSSAGVLGIAISLLCFGLAAKPLASTIEEVRSRPAETVD